MNCQQYDIEFVLIILSYIDTKRIVCRSVTTVSPANAAEPFAIPFGMLTRSGPRNQVLD